MADFGCFSDTDEDSAVEELISQAKELSVLEQVSAINCSGFTNSVLPAELESRFQKLKSFPATRPRTHIDDHQNDRTTSRVQSLQHAKSEGLLDSMQNPDKESGSKKAKSVSSSDSSPSSAIFSQTNENPKGKFELKENSRRGSASVSSKSKSFSSPLSSPSSRMDSPSPPQRKGCFWCSPKSSSSRTKIRETPMIGSDLELLSDLSTFSVKEQEKMLKKAMKEEEKINREAEKIVKWAKQASMRISDHGGRGALDDELSDD